MLEVAEADTDAVEDSPSPLHAPAELLLAVAKPEIRAVLAVVPRPGRSVADQLCDSLFTVVELGDELDVGTARSPEELAEMQRVAQRAAGNAFLRRALRDWHGCAPV